MRWSHMLYAALCAVALSLVGHACSSDNSANTTQGAGGGTSVGGGNPGVGGGGVTCIAGLASITLAPDNGTVTLDGVTAAPITFIATGHFTDGHSEDIAGNRLAWTATRTDDTPPGTIVDGVFSPYPFAGGLVTISATDTCVSGETTANFFVDAIIGQPGDPNDWLGMPGTGPLSPAIVYPSDKTRFPRNIYRTIFQWRSQGLTEFRLIYEGMSSKVTVYTNGVHGLCTAANPPAGCWEVNEIAWAMIASSNAGGTASWIVDALDKSTTPPSIWRSSSIELGFSKQDVEGAIFYWSTTSAGIRRARISQQFPEDYIVGKPTGTQYANDTVDCVACHVVSRDGQYMAAPVKSSIGDSLWVMQVTQNPPPTPLVTDVTDTGGHGFATISPDNAHVVVSFKKDHMWMVDRATGAFQMDLPTQSFGGGTHPDWSPDGTQVVFASDTGDGPQDASLVLIPWTGSSWGQPTTLLAPPMGMTNLFPMFSPAGDWVAFSQGSQGGHGDITAQLWLVNENGGTPVELVNASRVTSNQMTTGQYQSSQPTWAPPGDYNWIAFNTKREFGVITPEGTQQIWVAAVDLSKAANGQDASYPAFRVPFQGLDENNHRAYWTLDINGEGGGGQGGNGQGGGPGCPNIITAGQPCDPLNDCCETGTYCDLQNMAYICYDPTPN